jgi:hypothetical protein
MMKEKEREVKKESVRRKRGKELAQRSREQRIKTLERKSAP